MPQSGKYPEIGDGGSWVTQRESQGTESQEHPLHNVILQPFPGHSFCCPFSAPCSHFSEGHPKASWCLNDIPGQGHIFVSG